ncbi:MAG: hypothetical protein ACKV19_25780 [Verrucomicrobiales bacterium]
MALRLRTSDPEEDLPDEIWQPAPELRWWQRWRRGWRLAVVVVGVAVAYVLWRGPTDYRAAKAWRGRILAGQAREAMVAGDGDVARRLLDRAGMLGPRDALVLRTIADFAESRDDVMALYALRQLQSTGQADEADLLRQAQLAFDWGRPELAPVDAVRAWAGSPADSLDAARLEAGAWWLAGRGRLVEAEARLRRAIDTAVAAGEVTEARRLSLALAQLLVSTARGRPTSVRVDEAIARWLQVGQDAAAAPGDVAEAMEQAAAAVVAFIELSSGDEPEWAGSFSEVLAYRLDTAPDATRGRLRVAQASWDRHRRPWEGSVVADDLVLEALDAPAAPAWHYGRWLQRHGFFEQTVRLAEARLAGENPTSDWFFLRLDGLFGQKQWELVRQALEATGAPVSPTKRRLFLYRLVLASEAGSTAIEEAQSALRDALRTAEAAEVLEVASNLEAAGDRSLAIECYHQVQRHERVGLPARLGLVRCLHQEPNETAELIDTLQSLLTLWPDSDEARADLAYLRLLPPQVPRADDVDAARRLVEAEPQFLAFRVVAALAALRQGEPKQSMALTSGEPVPWELVPPGWRAVHACLLAANQRPEEAGHLAASLTAGALRPGERELLRSFGLTPGS